MDEGNWNKIKVQLIDCTTELFASVGVTFSNREERSTSVPPVKEEGVVAFIGFSGDQLKGTLTLYAPKHVIRSSHPAAGSNGGSDLSQEDLNDWGGELANQLLGRLKNRLLSMGATIKLSTPATLSGRDIWAVCRQKENGCDLSFVSGDLSVRVMFDALAATGVELTDYVAAEQDAQPEGELMFF